MRRIVPALASLAALCAVTGAIFALRPVAPVVSLGVLYLLAVLPVAIFWGHRYALPVAVASMLAFNFFFLAPVHTLRLHDSENWVALAVYLTTAVVVSELASRGRRRADDAEQRRREAAFAAEVSAALLEATPVQSRLTEIGVPARHSAAPGRGRRGRGDPLRRPARLRLGRVRAHRRRGDLERRQRVQAAEGQERGRDARRARADRDLALPRRLLPRRAGDDVRDPDPRREHVLPGLPAPRRGAREGPVLPAPVREPRRPARLLERDRRPRGPRLAPHLDLPRERQLADPPVRDRRLHRVHALAGRDGALLAPAGRPGVAATGRDQRRRRRGDRDRRAARRRDEVPRRGVDGDRGRSGADRLLLPRQPPLPHGWAAPARRHLGGGGRSAGGEPGRPLRRRGGRGAPRGALVRVRDRGRRLPR